jgi:hypothetical protein
LPKLENLTIDRPLDFDLNLRDFPALMRLRLVNGDLRGTAGRLPNLTHLSITEFNRIDSSWIHPTLLCSLQVLQLHDLNCGDIVAFRAAVLRYSAEARPPSSLHTLTLHSQSFRCASHRTLYLNNLLTSLTERSFPELRHLDFRAPDDDDSDQHGFRDVLLRPLPQRFPRLHELVLMRGGFDEWQLKEYDSEPGEDWVSSRIDLFASRTRLTFPALVEDDSPPPTFWHK